METEHKLQPDDVKYFKMYESSIFISILEQFIPEIKEKFYVSDLVRKNDGRWLVELTERHSLNPYEPVDPTSEQKDHV